MSKTFHLTVSHHQKNQRGALGVSESFWRYPFAGCENFFKHKKITKRGYHKKVVENLLSHRQKKFVRGVWAFGVSGENLYA